MKSKIQAERPSRSRSPRAARAREGGSEDGRPEKRQRTAQHAGGASSSTDAGESDISTVVGDADHSRSEGQETSDADSFTVGRGKRPADGGDAQPAQRRRRNEVDLTTDIEGGRPARHTDKRPMQYDETKRREVRPRRTGYMDRGGQGYSVRTKRSHAAMVIGTAVIERVVRGRYEWRDGGLRERGRG